MGMFGRRAPESVVTHLMEVECPVTGRSRMFSGPCPEQVEAEAHEWLETRFGGPVEPSDREVSWD